MKETKEQKKEKQKATSELTKIANKVKQSDNGNSKEVSRLYKIITNVISVLVHPVPAVQLIRILRESLKQGKLVQSDIKKAAIDSRLKIIMIALAAFFIKKVHQMYRMQVDAIVTENIRRERIRREANQRIGRITRRAEQIRENIRNNAQNNRPENNHPENENPPSSPISESANRPRELDLDSASILKYNTISKYKLMTHDNMPWVIKRIRFIDDEQIVTSEIPKAKESVNKLIKVKEKIKQVKNKHPVLGKLFSILTKIILIATHPFPLYKLIKTVKQSIMEIKSVKKFFETKEGKELNKTVRSIIRVSLTILIDIAIVAASALPLITGLFAERTARRETMASIRENNRIIAEQERRRREREEENRRNLNSPPPNNPNNPQPNNPSTEFESRTRELDLDNPNSPPPNNPSTGFEGRARELDLDSAINILKYNNHWAF